MKSPVAWRPPVEAKVAWDPRSVSGSDFTMPAAIVSALSTGTDSTATASSAPLPQTPHEEDV